MMRSASASRLRDCQSGATAVEFALVSPVLLTMIVGVFALGMAYYEGATIQWSLERTLRAAMIDPDLDAGDIEAMLREELGRIDSPDIAFSYEIEDEGAVALAVARAEYDVPLLIPFVPDLALHFAAESVMPAPQS